MTHGDLSNEEPARKLNLAHLVARILISAKLLVVPFQLISRQFGEKTLQRKRWTAFCSSFFVDNLFQNSNKLKNESIFWISPQLKCVKTHFDSFLVQLSKIEVE